MNLRPFTQGLLYLPEARGQDASPPELPEIIRELGGVKLTFRLTDHELEAIFKYLNLFYLCQDAAEALFHALYPNGRNTGEPRDGSGDPVADTYGCTYEDMCDPNRSEFYLLSYLVQQFLLADTDTVPQSETWATVIQQTLSTWLANKAERDADRVKPKQSRIPPDPTLVQVFENGDEEPVMIRFNNPLDAQACEKLDAVITDVFTQSLREDPDTPLSVIALHAGSRFLNEQQAVMRSITSVELVYDGDPGWSIHLEAANEPEPAPVSAPDRMESEPEIKPEPDPMPPTDPLSETPEQQADDEEDNTEGDWESPEEDGPPEEGPPFDGPPDDIPDDVP